MTSKSRSLYRAVFGRVIEIVGDTVAAHLVHTDYEAALMESSRDFFGPVKGCFFHYTQAVLRKFKSLHLQSLMATNESLKLFFRRVTSLPLSPTGQIHGGNYAPVRPGQRDRSKPSAS